MAKTKPNKITKIKGISAKLPHAYYRKLRAEIIDNDMKSVGEWMRKKLDEGDNR